MFHDYNVNFQCCQIYLIILTKTFFDIILLGSGFQSTLFFIYFKQHFQTLSNSQFLTYLNNSNGFGILVGSSFYKKYFKNYISRQKKWCGVTSRSLGFFRRPMTRAQCQGTGERLMCLPFIKARTPPNRIRLITGLYP